MKKSYPPVELRILPMVSWQNQEIDILNIFFLWKNPSKGLVEHNILIYR